VVAGACAGGPALAATPQSVCLASARRAIALRLGVKTASVGERASQGANGMPQCAYGIARAHRGGPHSHVLLIANVDIGPQAQWRLMRKVSEATQIFGQTPPGWHAPIGLSGLGPYASWFINIDTLMAVNHARTELLSVSVSWPRAKRAEMVTVARAAVVPYIHARP
jgi:DNA-binding transcriptional regulator YdaS (Cro superfamily)